MCVTGELLLWLWGAQVSIKIFAPYSAALILISLPKSYYREWARERLTRERRSAITANLKRKSYDSCERFAFFSLNPSHSTSFSLPFVPFCRQAGEKHQIIRAGKRDKVSSQKFMKLRVTASCAWTCEGKDLDLVTISFFSGDSALGWDHIWWKARAYT